MVGDPEGIPQQTDQEGGPLLRPQSKPDEYEAQKDYIRGKPLSPRGISSTAMSAATLDHISSNRGTPPGG
ncbi:UNVERIFIED_CONTAM: hypothetical protein Sradi_0829300 [Sesamum radiatum]|uniref:Uncharacterized protein n=1 Tax=Sesamum radiatum TaxID=300843 RepID=A0AAW2VS64_SESRA